MSAGEGSTAISRCSTSVADGAEKSRGHLCKDWFQAARPRGAGAKPPASKRTQDEFPGLLEDWLKVRGIDHLFTRDEETEKREKDERKARGSERGQLGKRRWYVYKYTGAANAREVTKDWQTAYHGTWWYAVWSIADSGVMLESSDYDAGHDFWQPGVYCSPQFETACYWYARPHIVFDDGAYHRVVLELKVDTSRLLRNRQRGGQQWVLPADAVSVVAMRFKANSPPRDGEQRLINWDPNLEVVPQGKPTPEVVRSRSEPRAEEAASDLSETDWEKEYHWTETCGAEVPSEGNSPKSASSPESGSTPKSQPDGCMTASSSGRHKARGSKRPSPDGELAARDQQEMKRRSPPREEVMTVTRNMSAEEAADMVRVLDGYRYSPSELAENFPDKYPSLSSSSRQKKHDKRKRQWNAYDGTGGASGSTQPYSGPLKLTDAPDPQNEILPGDTPLPEGEFKCSSRQCKRKANPQLAGTYCCKRCHWHDHWTLKGGVPRIGKKKALPERHGDKCLCEEVIGLERAPFKVAPKELCKSWQYT